MKLDTSRPVLLLGGRENSLAIARHFGRLGITVRVSGGPGCLAMHSRYCRARFPASPGSSTQEYWANLLLTGRHTELRGHVIFPCNDQATEFLALHRSQLEEHYLLDDFKPAIHLAMLDKLRTLELAREAGVPAPKFWEIKNKDDIDRIRDEVTFPVMVKPIHSHKFFKVFNRKLFIIETDFEELTEKVGLALENNVDVMIVDMVPGPDSLLTSYYTYIDSAGTCLFHFTKRVIRRFPILRGSGCYHETKWLPETAELGLKYFRNIGFTGLGNIEFKHDQRDDTPKIIEVNPRFTAAHVLVLNSGMPLDLITYCHVTGQSIPKINSFQELRRLWYPIRDLRSFWQLRERGELTFPKWLGSILHLPFDLPFWSSRDPLPSISLFTEAAAGFIARRRNAK